MPDCVGADLPVASWPTESEGDAASAGGAKYELDPATRPLEATDVRVKSC